VRAKEWLDNTDILMLIVLFKIQYNTRWRNIWRWIWERTVYKKQSQPYDCKYYGKTFRTERCYFTLCLFAIYSYEVDVVIVTSLVGLWTAVLKLRVAVAILDYCRRHLGLRSSPAWITVVAILAVCTQWTEVTIFGNSRSDPVYCSGSVSNLSITVSPP